MKRTISTPSLSAASTVIVVAERSVSPSPGWVIATVGGVMSGEWVSSSPQEAIRTAQSSPRRYVVRRFIMCTYPPGPQLHGLPAGTVRGLMTRRPGSARILAAARPARACIRLARVATTKRIANQRVVLCLPVCKCLSRAHSPSRCDVNPSRVDQSSRGSRARQEVSGSHCIMRQSEQDAVVFRKPGAVTPNLQ